MYCLRWVCLKLNGIDDQGDRLSARNDDVPGAKNMTGLGGLVRICMFSVFEFAICLIWAVDTDVSLVLFVSVWLLSMW